MKISEEILKIIADDKQARELMRKTDENVLLEILCEKKADFLSDCFVMVSNNSADIPEKFHGSVKNVTGYGADELEKTKGGLLSIIHEDDLEEYKHVYLKLARSEKNEPITHRFRIKHKTGKIVWLEEKVILRAENEQTVYERFLRDVSYYYEIEEKLRRDFLRVSNMNRVKDKFISIVSHDLRAPFTSLIGFAEILLNEPDLPQEEREDYLRYIYDAAQTQLTLVNHLLDWSRLQSGKIEVEPARLNVRSTVSSAVSSLTGAAVRKGVEIEINIPEDLFFYADPKLIDRIISNLLSNALKFTPEGKKITVEAGKYGEDKIEVIVKDEGIGIKEEDQSKIFKLDEKITTEGTSGEKGTGLGLMLVKEIVEKHGGEIWFYSQEGKGTEFHFTIPEAKQIFLIIEDDLRARELFKKHIRNIYENAEIIEAENGYEALNIAYKKIPSLIISDHDMPLMNGLQFLEVIKKNPKLKNVPVIIISGALDSETASEYRKHGVSEILEKPLETEKFINLLKFLN